MKKNLTVIFLFLSIQVFAQPCGGQYPSGLYHNLKFVSINGDTLNKQDSMGFYEGLHLYSNDENNLFNDTITYTIGHYRHGLPIGEWKSHCKDGSFSIGQYACGGGEISPDGKGGTIERHQGIYKKTGIWKYFDRNNQLTKVEMYKDTFDRKGWTNKTYLKDSEGNFILVSYDFNDRHDLESIFKKRIEKKYSAKGIPISYFYEGFWGNISYVFYSDGKIKYNFKQKKFLGMLTRISIKKEFDEKGKLKCKTRNKCKPTQYEGIY